jgi:hypothetical protein
MYVCIYVCVCIYMYTCIPQSEAGGDHTTPAGAGACHEILLPPGRQFETHRGGGQCTYVPLLPDTRPRTRAQKERVRSGPTQSQPLSGPTSPDPLLRLRRPRSPGLRARRNGRGTGRGRESESERGIGLRGLGLPREVPLVRVSPSSQRIYGRRSGRRAPVLPAHSASI